MSKSESEPVYAKSGDKTQLPWYSKNIDKYLVPQTQELLETYSGVPKDQQSEHVHKIRDEAWAIRAYPCTGLGVWLVPYISYSPSYSKVLSRVKSGGTFLDVGCLLGGDMRRLVFDGAPSDKIHGIDIISHWDVGYDMYRDRDRFAATFVQADLLSADENPQLAHLRGKVDVISISAVMHQWTWENQVSGGKQLVKFSSGPGAVVVGHQIGSVKEGEVEFKGIKAYKQTPESWTRLWEQIGKETGTKWEVEAGLREFDAVGWDPKDMGWMAPTDRVLDYFVTRVE